MKASSIWSVLSQLLLIALVIHNVPQSEALSPLETCQLVKNATFIADPADCQGWYYCLNGQAIAGKCKTGFLYNSYTGSCDYPNNVVCGANVTTICNGQNAMFKADPNSCEGYCYCTNGVAECTTCPDGQLFNIDGPSCSYPTADNPNTCVSGSPCLLVQNTFIWNSAQCNTWYRCFNGQVSNGGSCDTGYYYDPSKGECNYESQVDCTVPAPSPAPGPAPGPPPGVIEPTAAACANAPKKFLPDGKTCRGYFYCNLVNNAYEFVWGQCPEGSQFSASTGTCTNPYNANPPCPEGDRCEGSLLKYMAVKGQNCGQYVVCTDNVSSSPPSSCLTTGYTFFDEKLQACVNAKPNFPICTIA